MKLYLEPNSTLFYINGKIGKLKVTDKVYSCTECSIQLECSTYSKIYVTSSFMLCKKLYKPSYASYADGFILLSVLIEDRNNVESIKYMLQPILLKSVYLHHYMIKLMSNSAHYNLNK